MQRIYHKRNELLEVEFYQDKDCKILFDFTKEKDLYIELKDGDCMPIFMLHTLGSFKIFTPYIPLCVSHEFKYGLINTYIQTLDNITTNLSRYIPEDNAVLFLNDNDFQNYNKYFFGSKFSLIQYPVLDKCNLRKSLNFTIFLFYGTLSELQKANEIAKELKEKYGVKEVNLFILHCFINLYGKNDYINLINLYCKKDYINAFVSKGNDFPEFYSSGEIFNKIITTHSTGLLEPKDNENLQVIDCFDIFNEALF